MAVCPKALGLAVCPKALAFGACPNTDGADDCPNALKPPPLPNAEGVDACPKAETVGFAVLPKAEGAPNAGAVDDEELVPKALGVEFPNAGPLGLMPWFMPPAFLYLLRFCMACCNAALAFCAIPWYIESAWDTLICAC